MAEIEHPREYNLEGVKVLHEAHPFQNDPGQASAAVIPGFEWATAGEGQGLFLCRDTGPCKAPDECGRTFWSDRPERPKGHEIEVYMPWAVDSAGTLEMFDLWCCENCAVQGSGAVFDVWVGRFYDLPARLLAYLHEKRGQTYIGLRKSMGKAYPDQFNETSFVTLILYRRTL